MLTHMRTTVILPDELYRQVKERARAQERTVTSFLEDALRQALIERDDERSAYLAEPYRPSHGRGGVRPGVDINSNAALEELMDEDDFTVRSIREHQATRA